MENSSGKTGMDKIMEELLAEQMRLHPEINDNNKKNGER